MSRSVSSGFEACTWRHTVAASDTHGLQPAVHGLQLGAGVHLGAMHRRVASHHGEASGLESRQVGRHVYLVQLGLAALRVALVEHVRRCAWLGLGLGLVLGFGLGSSRCGGVPVHAKSAVPEPSAVPPSATQCLTHAAMGTPAPCSPRTWRG